MLFFLIVDIGFWTKRLCNSCNSRITNLNLWKKNYNFFEVQERTINEIISDRFRLTLEYVANKVFATLSTDETKVLGILDSLYTASNVFQLFMY